MLSSPQSFARTLTLARSGVRSVWSSATFLSDSPVKLLESLRNQPPPTASPSAQVFAISKNVPYALVELLQAALVAHCAVPTVGALTELLPQNLTAKLAPKLSPNPESIYSLSVARYTPEGAGRAIPWRSSLVGRKGVSVGREIKSGPRADKRGLEGSEAAFEAFMSGKKWGFGDQKKGGEESIDALEGVAPSRVSQVVLFGADRTQPVLNAVSAYTNSSTLGLIGSSTPFHSPSHAPFSLFFNGELSSTGAVGLAIVDEAPASPLSVDYASLQQLGKAVEVTDAKGNIVLTLDNQNAARTLLNLVQEMPETIELKGKTAAERGSQKEREFYAAVFEREPTTPLDLTQARHVSRIMAGDPSRGAMSVETEEDVRNGSHLVFLTRAGDAQPSQPRDGLSFISLAPSYSNLQSVEDAPEDGEVVVVEGAFLAGSENGVVVSRAGGGCWVCGVEGAVASMA